MIGIFSYVEYKSDGWVLKAFEFIYYRLWGGIETGITVIEAGSMRDVARSFAVSQLMKGFIVRKLCSM